MPPGGKYISLPEHIENSKIANILVSDAGAIGALRIDPASADKAYQMAAKEALMADVSDDLFHAVLNLCTPDAPASDLW